MNGFLVLFFLIVGLIINHLLMKDDLKNFFKKDSYGRFTTIRGYFILIVLIIAVILQMIRTS